MLSVMDRKGAARSKEADGWEDMVSSLSINPSIFSAAQPSSYPAIQRSLPIQMNPIPSSAGPTKSSIQHGKVRGDTDRDRKDRIEAMVKGSTQNSLR
jgi:hypothetical protein